MTLLFSIEIKCLNENLFQIKIVNNFVNIEDNNYVNIYN